jgi:outer membrane protein assembly factor BamA
VCVAGVPAPLWGQNGEERGLVVRELSFEGNMAIDDHTLRRSIATTQSSLFARSPLLRWIGLGAKSYLKETELRRDVLRIEALYRLSGFVDAAVDTLVRRTETDAYVTFVVSEGEPVRVTTLRISGVEDLMPVERLSRAIPLRVGSPFNRLLFRASVDTIRTRLAERGHPYAEVYRNFDLREAARTAEIEFAVDPGPRVTVDTVEVVGTETVDDKVVRNTLWLQEGRVYNWRHQYRSQLDLYRTEMFNYVNVGLVDTLPEGPDDTLVTVRAQVAEGPMRRIRFGAGYGTVDCFRGHTAWTVHNFTGGGRRLDLFAGFSKIGTGDPLSLEGSLCPALREEDPERLKLNYNLTAGLTQPFVFHRRASATLALFAERHSELQAFVREAIGGELSWSYRIAWRMPITLSYNLSYGSTKADPVTFCTFLNVCRVEDTEVFTQPAFRAAATVAFVKERREPLIDPVRGSRLAAELRLSGPVVGSDSLTQFLKGTVEYASHHRVGRRSVVGWRVKIGAIVAPTRGFEGQDLRFVPVDERFYAGGPNTVRGFPFNELGPIVRVIQEGDRDTIPVGDTTVVGNTRTSAVGGNDIFLANVEWRYSLSRTVTAAVFLDAGQVMERDSSFFDLSKLRVTPGVGIRFASPLGPIRFDVGFNPYEEADAPTYVQVGNELILWQDLFPGTEPPKPARSFLDRFRLNFSIGQAF